LLLPAAESGAVVGVCYGFRLITFYTLSPF
jgi:hypothetical protein